MKKYDTIIFDLDGTLLNTLDDLSDSVNFSLTQNGLPIRSKTEVRKFLGNGIANLIERSVPNGTANPKYQKCLDDFKNHYSQNMQNKTNAYDGIIDLLTILRDRHYKLAIVSNKFDAAVKKLNRNYFAKYIEVAIGESATILKKPAPDTVYKALQQLKSDPKKAVYIGDSEVDVKTAQNSHLPCIGVTWGFRDRELLEERGADYIVDDPREILEIVS